MADRVSFEAVSATEYPAPAGDYDLIAFFDCLHDLGDPVGAVRHARETLAADGTVMIVEPMAGERVEENLHPLGRALSGASTMLCTAHSLATGGRPSGRSRPKRRSARWSPRAGCASSDAPTETPFNRIFEARR